MRSARRGRHRHSIEGSIYYDENGLAYEAEGITESTRRVGDRVMIGKHVHLRRGSEDSLGGPIEFSVDLLRFRKEFTLAENYEARENENGVEDGGR